MASRSSETPPSRAGACPQKHNCSRRSPYYGRKYQDKGTCSNKNGTNKPRNIDHKKNGSSEPVFEQKQGPMAEDSRPLLAVIDDCKGNTDSTMSGTVDLLWYCCVCRGHNDPNRLPGPWGVGRCPSCQTCGHEQCDRCEVEPVECGD